MPPASPLSHADRMTPIPTQTQTRESKAGHTGPTRRASDPRGRIGPRAQHRQYPQKGPADHESQQPPDRVSCTPDLSRAATSSGTVIRRAAREAEQIAASTPHGPAGFNALSAPRFLPPNRTRPDPLRSVDPAFDPPHGAMVVPIRSGADHPERRDRDGFGRPALSVMRSIVRSAHADLVLPDPAWGRPIQTS